MVTGVGILSGFGSAVTLGFHLRYLALAIGCGSLVGNYESEATLAACYGRRDCGGPDRGFFIWPP